MGKREKYEEGKVHESEGRPIFIEKAVSKSKDKKFDIEKIFDHGHKKGKEVAVAPKERKKIKETLVFSFLTRDEGKVAKSYNKHLPFK